MWLAATRGRVVTTGSGLLIPAPAVLVQFLPSSCVPSVRVFRAEVGTEAIGGGSQGCLCTALKGRPVEVQILLCKVGIHFCKPAEVGWKDKETCGYWELGGRCPELMALPWVRMGAPTPSGRLGPKATTSEGRRRMGRKMGTPVFSAAPKITEKQGGGDCILSTIPLWEFKESMIVSSVVHSGNLARVREAPLITGSAQGQDGASGGDRHCEGRRWQWSELRGDQARKEAHLRAVTAPEWRHASASPSGPGP